MTRSTTALVFLALTLSPTLSAQTSGCWVRGSREEAATRASPLDSVTANLDGGTVKICYGSPSARGRTMLGGVDPYGQPWRMGAKEAPALHVTVSVDVAGVTLAPGSYSLYAIPTDSTWTIVVNRDFQRWGIPLSSDVRARDMGQATLTPEALPEHVEALRFRFEPKGVGRVDLVLEWESTRLSIPMSRTG